MRDYLIVGQGIAGSFLSWEFLQRKKTFTIIDQNHQGSSSMISAGIMNPVIGKRFSVSPDYAQYFASATQAYNTLEQFFSQKFFTAKPLLRLFRDEEERTHCQQTIDFKDQSYMSAIKPPGAYPHLHDEWGSVLIDSTGFCKSEALIVAFREHFNRLGVLQSGKFDFNGLAIADNHIGYGGESYGRVIFCEGYQTQFNPFFKWIPFNNAKGEILKIRMPDTGLPDMILNKGQWALPLRDTWSVGSNHDWDHLDCMPTEQGKKEILDGVNAMLPGPKDVVGHQAGVRPVIKDLKPILGSHPEIPRLCLFNGLGTKGFLTAPFFASRLADHLCDNAPIPQDISVERFKESINE